MNFIEPQSLVGLKFLEDEDSPGVIIFELLPGQPKAPVYDITVALPSSPRVPKAPSPVGFTIAWVGKSIGKGVKGFKEGGRFGRLHIYSGREYRAAEAGFAAA